MYKTKRSDLEELAIYIYNLATSPIRESADAQIVDYYIKQKKIDVADFAVFVSRLDGRPRFLRKAFGQSNARVDDFMHRQNTILNIFSKAVASALNRGEKDEFFSVEDLAESLSMAVGTIRLMITSGEIKAVKIRNQYRVKRSDFDAFLEANTVVSKPAPDETGNDNIEEGKKETPKAPTPQPLKDTTPPKEPQAQPKTNTQTKQGKDTSEKKTVGEGSDKNPPPNEKKVAGKPTQPEPTKGPVIKNEAPKDKAETSSRASEKSGTTSTHTETKGAPTEKKGQEQKKPDGSQNNNAEEKVTAGSMPEKKDDTKEPDTHPQAIGKPQNTLKAEGAPQKKEDATSDNKKEQATSEATKAVAKSTTSGTESATVATKKEDVPQKEGTKAENSETKDKKDALPSFTPEQIETAVDNIETIVKPKTINIETEKTVEVNVGDDPYKDLI